MADRRRRGRSGWLLGAILVLALLWVGYWYAAHYLADAAIARIARGPVDGTKIACREIALGGFPLRLDIRCTRGSFERGTATGELGGFAASAPLYWPGSVAATIDGPLTINAPDRGIALTATWTAGTATGGAGMGGLSGAAASFTTLKAENNGPIPGLPVTGVSADAASGALAPAGGGSYTVTASTTKLAIARADGVATPVLDADVRAVAEKVGDLGNNPADAILAWLRGTPTVTIERLRLAAAGAIVSASGTLSLSQNGLLNGSILLRYNSIEGLASLIEALKPGSGDKYAQALQGLQAMSKRVDSEDGPALQTTLTFTEGLIWLTIIPLSINRIPPIRF